MKNLYIVNMADIKKYTNKLQGSKILVIGGSSGVGFAVAEASVEYGASVIIVSSSSNKINASIEKLQASYPSAKGKITGIVTDLSRFATLEEDIVTLLDKAGSTLNHIVFTAGEAIKVLTLNDATPQELHDGSVLRYYAPLFLAKHAVKYLAPSPKSSITFTTGAISVKPIKGMALNNGIATAIQGITRGLALDIAPIRVNAVNIGAVETPLIEAYLLDGKARAIFADRTTTGKIGQPGDVAEAYLYLMKDENVTGANIFSESGALLL
jgi:NAD(P)-dependent dehydrogenase (short-subunit alcohol dehydrogenase family)